MAVSLGVSSKFVLVIGDEGATLLRVVGARVRDRCFASSSDPGDSAAMADMLAQSPTTPIYPLIDALEQSFTKETIPPAGMFDAARLIQRRLDAAFPHVAIKGAHYLGRDPGSERRDKRYLLAGLAGSPALNGWIAWINARRNPVKPLSLLPLEAVPVAQTLSRACHPEGDPPQWIMLVTRHRTGGFRQVVLRGGEFVFTRLTQGLAAGAPAAEVAAAIEREHRLSMGYMRRMSYSDDQGMDVLVVGAPAIGPALVDLGMPADQVHAIAPADAAACLQVAEAAKPGDVFAEALHGAAFALKRRPVMALLPQELYEKRAGALVTSAAYAVIALVIGYASFGLSDAFLVSQDIDRAYDQASLQTKQREARLGAVADEAGDIQVSGLEVVDTIALHDSLSAQAPSPLPLLAIVGTALTPQTVIHKIDWEVGEHAAKREVSLALTLHIDASVASVGDAVDVADAFAARVAERLPGLDVRVTDPPIDILPDQVLSGEIDLTDSPDEETGAGYDAVISIFLPAGWPVEPAS